MTDNAFPSQGVEKCDTLAEMMVRRCGISLRTSAKFRLHCERDMKDTRTRGKKRTTDKMKDITDERVALGTDRLE